MTRRFTWLRAARVRGRIGAAGRSGGDRGANHPAIRPLWITAIVNARGIGRARAFYAKYSGRCVVFLTVAPRGPLSSTCRGRECLASANLSSQVAGVESGPAAGDDDPTLIDEAAVKR
jgi:hypothetical protein